ncbi:hypothetical protein NPIL_225811 [Nephila pilipes]|uniref:Uncharacterized protein n=1 Tax=Nephila pilipes TaxID=299642 RepID=A0A8X6QLY2_NEPPI|nr:hypothetical protein NPIL_225811 [Nephila pilipes]
MSLLLSGQLSLNTSTVYGDVFQLALEIFGKKTRAEKKSKKAVTQGWANNKERQYYLNMAQRIQAHMASKMRGEGLLYLPKRCAAEKEEKWLWRRDGEIWFTQRGRFNQQDIVQNPFRILMQAVQESYPD